MRAIELLAKVGMTLALIAGVLLMTLLVLDVAGVIDLLNSPLVSISFFLLGGGIACLAIVGIVAIWNS